MAIDWGTLSKVQIPTGGVVANLPQQNPIGNLGAGIMQGLGQGASIQGQMLQNQGMQMQNQAAQQQLNDSQTLRNAAKQGVDAWLSASDQIDPTIRLKYKKADADYKNVLADTAGRWADTKTKQAMVVQQTAIALGQVADAAHNAEMQSPGSGNKVYNLMLDQLDPQTQANLKDKGLGEWNEQTNVLLHAGSMEARAQALEAQKRQSSSTAQKDDETIADLGEKEKAGEISPQEQVKLDNARARQKSQAASGEQVTSRKESTLRDDFNKETQDFRDVNASYSRIKATAEKPSPAGDIALIFNYMKMLDPRSVVREGEFATAQNAGSLPVRIRAQYNKLMSGERLTEEQRSDFLGQSKNLYNAQNKIFEKTKETYIKRSKNMGLTPENIINDFRINPEQGQAPVSPGQSATSGNLTYNPQTGRLE